jgi:hypothetical protein
MSDATTFCVYTAVSVWNPVLSTRTPVGEQWAESGGHFVLAYVA